MLTTARACQARAAHVPRCSGCFGAQPVSLAREGSRALLGFGNSGVKLPLGASLLAVTGMSGGPQEVVWDQAWNSAPKSGVGHRLSHLNACIPSHVPRNLTTPPMVYHLRSLLVRAWLGGSCLPGLGAERGRVVGRVWAPSRADMARCGSWHQLLSQALAKMPPLRLCPSPCLSSPITVASRSVFARHLPLPLYIPPTIHPAPEWQGLWLPATQPAWSAADDKAMWARGRGSGLWFALCTTE